MDKKIEQAKQALKENVGKVLGYKTKYRDKYGFSVVYFAVSLNNEKIVIPAYLLPDMDDTDTDYIKFKDFLKVTTLDKYLIHDGVLDDASLVSILKFAEYERFKLSGKKAPHLDTSEYNYIKTIKGIIKENFNYPSIRCVYDESTHSFCVFKFDENDYFDEARELLGF